jgi:enoyl-CoA hydratase
VAEGPVLVEQPGGGVAKLTLNNPPLNLVTLEMTERLIEALDELERDDAVRAVVITGAGEKAFCAGSDVGEFADVRDRVVEKKLAKENEAFGRFEALSRPTVAALENLAYGGGCEISMACDLRIAGQGAKFALPEVRLGVVPGSGGLFRLPELVGPARAMELMYLGEPIDAREAERLGLVNEVVAALEPRRLRQADAGAERPRLQNGGLRRRDPGLLREARAAFRGDSRDRR